MPRSVRLEKIPSALSPSFLRSMPQRYSIRRRLRTGSAQEKTLRGARVSSRSTKYHPPKGASGSAPKIASEHTPPHPPVVSSPGVSRMLPPQRKPSFPVSTDLRGYLRRYKRERELPITYDR